MSRSQPGPSLLLAISLRMASRSLRRAPGGSLLAISILALGLAAPTTFFSLLVGATRPLPVPGGERIVRMEVVQPARGGQALHLRRSDLEELRGSAGLENLGGFRTFLGTLIDRERGSTRVAGAALTTEVLPLLRTEPVLGRIPGVDEASSTILLGYGIWQDLFGGDPSALGRMVRLDGSERAVVGVLPDGFGFPFKQNAWVLLPPEPGSGEPLELVGRLADGMTPEGVETELQGRWRRGDARRAENERGAVLSVDTYTGSRGEGGEAVAFLGLVLVALSLLVIACANVANLLLVRGSERIRALGIQSALGAGRAHVAAQLLLEALLLAAIGGAIGLFLAHAVVDAIQNSLAVEHFGYFWMRMAIDGRVLAFMAALVVATALTAGTLPVLRMRRLDVHRVLKEEGPAGGMGGGGAWGRTFVTVQLGLSCAALVAAALSARSLGASFKVGSTLPTDELLMASVEVRSAQRDFVIDELEEQMGATPGLVASAVALGAPAYLEPFASVAMDGEAPGSGEARRGTRYNAVTPAYFPLLDIALRTGRGIQASDAAGTAAVAVVSESFARRFSPDRDILGRSVGLDTDGEGPRWHRVVGVVEDLDLGGGGRAAQEVVYLPLRQVSPESMVLIARTRGDASGAAVSLRAVVAAVDPSIPVWGVRTVEDAYAYLTRVPRTMGLMALGGGLSGLVVAAVGLYGLLAFRVRQRRRDLGVQLALGADRKTLALDVVRTAMAQVVPAMLLGLSVAWLAAPVIGVLLLDLDPRGPATYLGVAAVFLAVSLFAAAGPAIRAARVEPAEVLRGS